MKIKEIAMFKKITFGKPAEKVMRRLSTDR